MDNNMWATLLLILTMYLGTQVVIDHSGSTAAKQALKAYSSCLAQKPSSAIESSAEYDTCISGLQTQVKNLVDSGEIDLDDCELEEEDKTVAQCYLWVWYFPRKILLTDKDLLKSLSTQNNLTLLQKLQKYFLIFLENSSGNTKVSVTTQRSITLPAEQASDQRNVITKIQNFASNPVQTMATNLKVKLDEAKSTTGQKGLFQQLVSDITETVEKPAHAILNLPSKIATNSQSLISKVQHLVEQPAQILNQITSSKNVQTITPQLSVTKTFVNQPSQTKVTSPSAEEANPFSLFGKIGQFVNEKAQAIGNQIASTKNAEPVAPEVIKTTVVNQPTQTVVKPTTKVTNPFSFFDKLHQFVNETAHNIGKQFTSTTREIVGPLTSSSQDLKHEVKTQASNQGTRTVIIEPQQKQVNQEELLASQKNVKVSGLWNKVQQLTQPRASAVVSDIHTLDNEEVSETSGNQPSQTQVIQYMKPSNNQRTTQTFTQTAKQPKQQIKYVSVGNQRQYPSEVMGFQRPPKQSSQTVYEVIVPDDEEESQIMIQQPKQSQQTELYEIVVPENDQETDVSRIINQQSPKQTEVYEIVVPADQESTDETGLYNRFMKNVKKPQQTTIFQSNKPAVNQNPSNYQGLFSRLGGAFKTVADTAADIITQPLSRASENSQNRFSIISTQENPDQGMTLQKLRRFFPKVTFHSHHFNM